MSPAESPMKHIKMKHIKMKRIKMKRIKMKRIKMKRIKTAVLGAGAVGMMFCTIDVELHGNQVALWSDPEHTTDFDIMKQKGFISTVGLIEEDIDVDFCEDLAHALHGAQDVYCAIPNQGIDALVYAIRKIYDQAIAQKEMKAFRIKHFFVAPGNYAAAVIAKILGKEKPGVIVELESAPINCRVLRDKQVVYLKGLKEEMSLATFPCQLPAATKKYIEGKLPNPTLKWLDDSMVLGFNLTGPKLHVPTMIASVSVIENPKFSEDAYMYKDMMANPGVARKINRISLEIRGIAVAYGIPAERVPDVIDVANAVYRMNAPELVEWARTTVSHNATRGMPDSMRHRYVGEDVPTVYTVWERMGQVVGANTDLLTAEIVEANVINAADYRATGRAATLGLYEVTTKEAMRKLFCG